METTIIAMPLLIALIALALAFDFLNGLHDAANSIATVVSTRRLVGIGSTPPLSLVTVLTNGCSRTMIRSWSLIEPVS